MLRPDRHVEQMYLYCLAEAASRYEITLLGFIAMSNHQHLLVRDNLGNFPAFLAHLNKMLAKALNAYWGRWENLWATEQPNAAHTVEPDDVFDKLVYLLANPVADHLVERVSDWPGATSLAQHLSGAPRTVKRPPYFFSKKGSTMPIEVTIRVERPEGFAHLSDAEWVAKLSTALRAREQKAREERASKGLSLLGRKAVLRALPTDRPRTLEPRRKLSPHVACRNAERRRYELTALRGFRAAHRAAIRGWLGGDQTVEFPAGTYRARIYGARCAGGDRAPPPAAS